MQRPLLALTLACLACVTGMTGVRGQAAAQPVLVTSPQTLSPGAMTITPTAGGAAVPLATADITVRGTTLTVNGRHTIRNLVVENNGVVTHTQGFSYDSDPVEPGLQEAFGMWLEVVANPVGGDVVVGVGSRIDVSGRGYAGGQGPGAGANSSGGSGGYGGGGGHGGAGGRGVSFLGGGVYGSATQPKMLGSGGGNRQSGGSGGPGGGAIRIAVSGTLTIDGAVLAEGQGPINPSNDDAGAGGAGGSVWITASTINGTGRVSANGGGGYYTDPYGRSSGGGGGGRIALYYGVSTVSGTTAYGAIGHQRGGPGTVYLAPIDQAPTIIWDNNNIEGAPNVLSSPLIFTGNIVLRRGSVVTHVSADPAGLEWVVDGNLSVDATSRIDVSGRGYAGGQGPGAGVNSSGGSGGYGGGGGHGGAGGRGISFGGGGLYGSVAQPTTLGSGGGNRQSGGGGGPGGGVIRIDVSGMLTIDGAVLAEGQSPINPSNDNAGAGGAGGSIWITAGTLNGAGRISTNGGAGYYTDPYGRSSGGGGGGRIALYYDASTFFGTTAYGATGHQRGGPGTIYIAPASQVATIVWDNNNLEGAPNILSSPLSFEGNMILRRGSVLTHAFADLMGLRWTVNGNVSVDTTSRIDVSGRGYAGGQGPGAGANSSGGSGGYGGGGGHGGAGGRGISFAGGGVYGSNTQPTTLGSGGGNRQSGGGGGPGGGVIRVDVTGVFTIDGAVLAEGQAPINPSNDNAGAGGAGGSVWITAATLNGTGRVSANGGTGYYTDPYGRSSGGGGGGRIALYSCNITLPISNFRVLGGNGFQAGQPGTLYFGSSSIDITQQPIGGNYRGGDFFQLGVQAISPNGELTYQWRKKNEAGEFVPLVEGQGGVFTEVTSNTLFVLGVSCDGGGDYDCLICDSCGCFPSNIAKLNVQSIADFNNDGGIDGSDIEAFFTAWESGDPIADVNQDGGIDGSDVELFFLRWEGGC